MIVTVTSRNNPREGLHGGPARFRPDAGVALLVALVFVALLSALVFGFFYDMEVSASSAYAKGDDFLALLAAKSAVAQAMGLLADDLAEVENSGMPAYDSELDTWSQGIPTTDLNDAKMRATISDEYGKINLNALFLKQGDQLVRNEQLVQALRDFFALRTAGDQKDPTDAILDWLDYDDMDAEEPEGAENSYYMGLPNPYPCKNGPMDSIEELLLIKGITPELYFGDPEQKQLPLSEYLTVHGDWRGRVNVNTAREEVIAAIVGAYTGTQDLGIGQQIYDEARMNPFEDLSRLSQFLPPPATPPASQQRPARTADGRRVDPRELERQRQVGQMQRMFRVDSYVFRIQGDGMKGDTITRIEAYVFRVPLDPRELEEYAANFGSILEGTAEPVPPEAFRVLDWRIIK
ncbi:MAG TPA: type II secretion system minor pseudopilin GspK [Candidatus Hydrogenedentes bacterium]|nr:type II secretion system minor pseudopilin GspK [Candidatus Hydrogenedentota bacterium]